jgi:putative NADH-flavin reductase
MKLAVFGANGRTGILLVYQALEKGHEVTAFARDPGKVTIRHEKLKIVRGDILDYGQVMEAVIGQDVVLSALGVISHKRSTVLSEGTANIIRAMEENGVKRFICISSAGVLGKDVDFVTRYIRIPLYYREEFRDKRRQLELIRQSDLDWIVIRPATLTDSPKTGKYQVTPLRPANRSVPRADVADFMLKLLTDHTYDRQTSAIAGY